MPRKRLTRKFYGQPALEVGQKILGKYLVHKIGDKEIIGKIVEIEVYPGPQDKASHAFNHKKTKRNQAEFLQGGHIYIYLVYGMYWQLNISTGKSDCPECVLIRALEPITLKKRNTLCHLDRGAAERRDLTHCNRDENPRLTTFARDNNKMTSLASGPGKLCNYMKISGKHYGLDLTRSKEVWVEDRGKKIPKSKIVSAKRIGIDYAGPYWASRKLRFYIKGNPYISRKNKSKITNSK